MRAERLCLKGNSPKQMPCWPSSSDDLPPNIPKLSFVGEVVVVSRLAQPKAIIRAALTAWHGAFRADYSPTKGSSRLRAFLAAIKMSSSMADGPKR
jgi:hypothetical protein